MKRPLLATPLAAALLLLSTLSCSKKEATPDPVTINGSYKMNGVLKNCQVKAYATSYNTDPQHAFDQVEVRLVTVPEPANGPEDAHIFLTKSQGQPLTAYVPNIMGYTPSGSNAGFGFNNATATLTLTSTGGYSGTFSGDNATVGVKATYTITDGVFTDAHP